MHIIFIPGGTLAKLCYNLTLIYRNLYDSLENDIVTRKRSIFLKLNGVTYLEPNFSIFCNIF